jgi:LacI family transcriptional regulator
MDHKTGQGPVNIEVFIGGAPLLELRLVQGLLRFGESHPQWRFALRGADVRYTPEWLVEQGVDGALVLIEDGPVAKPLDDAGVPWVHLLPGRSVPHPSVRVDDRRIGRMGAETYLARGFRRFAFCGVGTPWSMERYAGFRDRLAEEDLSCEMADIPFETVSNWTLASASDSRLRKWLVGLDRVCAVMAAHDSVANRIVDLCRQDGLRVPEDIAVLGVGNHELHCCLSPVPISSIDCAVPEVAMRGAAMLEDMLRQGSGERQACVPPVGTVERQSTEVIGFDNDLVNRVVAHIRDHACEGLRVDDLLKVFPASRRTLTRRFAEYVGHSPAAEIRRARLRHARRMIQQTDLRLREIATACGFADLPHMDRAFRSAFGKRPGAHRQ